MRLKHVLVAKLLFSICTCQSVAECDPVTLSTGQFVDDSCRVFRRVTENGVLSIVKEKDGKIIAREAVDCDKATRAEDGTLEYKLHIANGGVYCPSHKEDHGLPTKSNR